MPKKQRRVLVPDNEVPGKSVVAYSTPISSSSQPTNQSEGKDLWDGYVWVNPDPSYEESEGAQKMYLDGKWINVGLSIGETSHTAYAGARGVILEGRVGILENSVTSISSSVSSLQDIVNSISPEASSKLYKNVEVLTSSWQPDTTYARYPYRALVPLTEATDTTTPNIIFSLADVEKGIFAPLAESVNGGIYIYSSVLPANNIYIAKIILWLIN